jgi:xanthine dehydrogenase accessory factor
MECLSSGLSVVLDFDMDAASVSSAEPLCGGRMSILLDAAPEKHRQAFRSAAGALAGRKRGVMATCIRPSGRGVELLRLWVGEARVGSDPDGPFSILSEQIKQVFRTGRATSVRMTKARERSPAEAEGRFYLEPVQPSFRLLIAGGGHVGKALSHLGRLLEFEVTVIDDRSEFANGSNLPDAHAVVEGDFASALMELRPDRDTFVVIVTRGHSHDAEALRAVIDSKAGYIGMMGSKKKVALMRDHFISRGWCSADRFDAVHTPIGIDIASKTVQEIAVSIAAQLIDVRNRLQRIEG